jgi:hypothetical protein
LARRAVIPKEATVSNKIIITCAVTGSAETHRTNPSESGRHSRS